MAIRTVVADDVFDLRFMVRLALEKSGHFEVVAEAENGAQAVELVRDHRPDLIVLDVSMPVQDGLEALPQIHEVSPETKVAILSGFEAQRLAKTALDAGASAYLEKGIPPQQLVSALLRIFEGRPEAAGPAIYAAARGASDERETTQPAAPLEPTPIPAEELLNFVVHEIRNPLAVIQGFGVALRDQWDTLPEKRRYDLVTRMTSNAASLDSVLTNVMQMRSGDTADVALNWEVLEGLTLVERLVEEMKPLARNNLVEAEIEPDLPRVLVDSHRLKQVLVNLVVNASKFSPPGAPITIRGKRHPGGIVIEVWDRGPGIPPETRDKVFEKFVQLDPHGKGLGLGLFISRALMTAMRGDIWIGDRDEGATICVLVPRADDAAPGG